MQFRIGDNLPLAKSFLSSCTMTEVDWLLLPWPIPLSGRRWKLNITWSIHLAVWSKAPDFFISLPHCCVRMHNLQDFTDSNGVFSRFCNRPRTLFFCWRVTVRNICFFCVFFGGMVIALLMPMSKEAYFLYFSVSTMKRTRGYFMLCQRRYACEDCQNHWQTKERTGVMDIEISCPQCSSKNTYRIIPVSQDWVLSQLEEGVAEEISELL